MDSSFSHVSLLVPNAERSAAFLNSNGIETEEPETFESEGTKEIYIGSYSACRGLLLLVEAISEGPYSRSMMKRGPSLHHLAIDVLDIEGFAHGAQALGWQLHSVSARTMAYQTVWLFLKGVPTLIEVHQKPALSAKPLKVSRVEIPLRAEHRALFEGIGLGDVVTSNDEVILTVDGKRLSFSDLAGLR